MVVRMDKKNRRYHGTRSWGAGNIKNRRGAGDRGGTGKGGRKNKFTYMVKYEPERIRKKGFAVWEPRKLKEIDLYGISKLAMASSEQKPTIELKGYKVLSNGALKKAAIIKATGFSKKAQEKIRNSGGEAVPLAK